ncbi:trehalose utilization [Verrucomicrobiaceae bacterium SCGC AG-212-N21]|nr:trehalose utilization [Verrucomicrobiaceae bacterium SCGC AG-212-N21]
MNRRTLLSLACGLTLASSATAADKLKVLIVDGQNNHQWQITTPVLKHALEDSGAFTAEVSTSPAKGAPADAWNAWRPKFSDYAVVVSNYNGADWPEAVQKDFEAYVQNGGGFVAVHAANNSFPAWKAYNEMIGVGGWGGRNEVSGPWLKVRDGKLFRDTTAGSGGAHGPQHEFVVEIQNADHPITKGLPAKWLHAKDELYSKLRGPAQNVEILSASKSDLTSEMEPNMMVLTHGKGRVFHTTLGHADYSMLERGFFTILQRGTEWAATGDVKACAAVPADFNTADKISVVHLEGYPKQAPPAPKPTK